MWFINLFLHKMYDRMINKSVSWIHLLNFDMNCHWALFQWVFDVNLQVRCCRRSLRICSCSINRYRDVIMGAIASQITGVSIVYSIVCSGADQRKHQSTASLAFVRGIRRSPVNAPHKGPVTLKMFPFDDVIIWRRQSYDVDKPRWYQYEQLSVNYRTILLTVR